MKEHRKRERYSSYAKVVPSSQNNLGYLRDLSTQGCHVDFVSPSEVRKDSVVEIIVIPNEELGIDNFNLLLTVRWIQQDKLYFSIGGEHAMINDTDKESFDELLGYFSK